jgi:malate dehydrogenase (oxaloacetate-decarboxylating)
MARSFHVTSSGNAVTFRLRLDNKAGTLARATAAIGRLGGNIGAIDIVGFEGNVLVRDITVNTAGDEHVGKLARKLGGIEGIELLDVSDRTFALHRGGKINVTSKVSLQSRDQLSMAYTPGVARVSTAIHENPEQVYDFTIKQNMVAIVSDGTAVLGLGDIGPEAALPVMEGKAVLFREFAGVNAFPVCLATKDVEEIIRVVTVMAPGFGGVNLEDISAPRCFEIERRLKAELDIPVFHDDQHGTAVVLTAAFINALKVTGKKAADVKVVVAGVGAAGTACTYMLQSMGVEHILGCDRQGIVSMDRTDLNDEKRAYAEQTNPGGESGTLQDAMKGADVFVGLSGPNVLKVSDLKNMNPDPIVFALSNPTPEIMPEDALPHVAVMATGRSDYPNQINNVLCFPGLFKGALSCRARDINEEMKMAAAEAIAASVPESALTADYIVPSVFNREVAPNVALAVAEAAGRTGVARVKEPIILEDEE